MYIPSRRVLFLEIPKTGSTTVRRHLEETYGKLPLKGHVREAEALKWLRDRDMPVSEVVAVWRDPVERWFSAFRQVYADEWRDLDEALTHCMHTGRASQVVFKPQVWMLDGKGVARRFFLFPPEAALRYVGIQGEIGRENEGSKRWTMDDVRYRMGEIRDFVREDLEFEQNGLQEEGQGAEEVTPEPVTPDDLPRTKTGAIDKRSKEYKAAKKAGLI